MNTIMTIDIIGGGSIGLLLAAALRRSGAAVRVWTRTHEQARALSNEGLVVRDLNQHAIHLEQIEAYPLDQAGELHRERKTEVTCALLVVKQTHINQELLESLSKLPLSEDGIMVCYQNGIGHIEKLAEVLPQDALFRAVTTEAAKRLSGHEVQHTGSGTTYLEEREAVGPMRKNQLVKLDKQLNDAGFPTFLSKHIHEMITRKLLVNAVINPLTALLRIPNGQLLKKERRIELMRTIFEEIRDVYSREGFHLTEEDWTYVLNVCQNTADNTSSMLADVLAHRPTEIEAITGAILRMADRHGIQAPLQRMLYQLIQAL